MAEARRARRALSASTVLALMLVPHIGAFPFSRVEGLWRRSIVQVRGGRRLYGSQRPILTGQDQIIDLSPVTLSEVIPGGSGERVCIDFTSRLLPGEGVLVGSCCHSLILVHAETLPSEYAPPRPFRCNAGPVHAYCQLENGLTKYLCEIEAGDRVVVADQSGRTRALTVGRLKIEPREFVLVRWDIPLSDADSSRAEGTDSGVPGQGDDEGLAWRKEDGKEGERGQTFLQAVDTVRLVCADGSPVSATELSVGMSVLSLSQGAVARHKGEVVAGGAAWER